jgi:hypothetical protein
MNTGTVCVFFKNVGVLFSCKVYHDNVAGVQSLRNITEGRRASQSNG